MNITEHCHTPQRNFVQFGHYMTFSLVPPLCQISDVVHKISNHQNALSFAVAF